MNYRIVMIGQRGERDYVVKILEEGLPCIGDDDVEYAEIFPETCAKRIAKNIEKTWLHPHVSVELELANA